MITINNIERTTLKYHCDCGVIGECMFKPPVGNATILIEIRCPMCEATERIKLLKYDSEESKSKLKDSSELQWALIIDNKIKDNSDV